jgi:hypothetical protein
MLSLHEKPCVYANLSTMPSVRSNLSSHGVARSSVFLWDADWTYHAHLDSGYDCTQWTDRSLSRNLDESTCTLAFYGVKPPPPKPPPPPPPPPPPKPPRLHCFGPKATPTTATCKRVRADVARWSRQRSGARRALAGTNLALRRGRCRKPYRRAVCRTNGSRAAALGREIRTLTREINSTLSRY